LISPDAVGYIEAFTTVLMAMSPTRQSGLVP
jgi:hypothetical protein